MLHINKKLNSCYSFSQMGKRLMAKCRMLLQENEELGKVISSGRTSKLEAEIVLQKTMVTEMKTNQDGVCFTILLCVRTSSCLILKASQIHVLKTKRMVLVRTKPGYLHMQAF